MARLDFSNVTDSNFEVIPAGKYAGRIEVIEEQTSKAGNEMWKLTIQLIDPPYENRKVWDYLVFNEKSLWKIKRILSAAGLIDKDATEIEIEPSDLQGVELGVQLVVETSDQYDDRNTIKSYFTL